MSLPAWVEESLNNTGADNEPRLREALSIAWEALDATDIYFKALCEQWAANDGRLVSEKGVLLEGSEDIKRLCDVAGEKVGEGMRRIEELGK